MMTLKQLNFRNLVIIYEWKVITVARKKGAYAPLTYWPQQVGQTLSMDLELDIHNRAYVVYSAL